METPDIRALRMLAAVGVEGSITAASAALGVSQQAVSARMRALEAEVGEALITRSPRGSTLTATGLLVAGWAAPLLDAADDLTRALEALGRERNRVLAVAASLTIAEHLAPAWMLALRGGAGGTAPTEAHLTAANSAAVIELVRSGEVEIGFIESPDIPGDLGSVTVGRDALELVVSPGHPWARRRSVGAATLAATPLITREPGSGTRRALETALAEAGFAETAAPAAELSSTLAIRATAAGGLAPAVLSGLAVAEDLRRGALVRVPVRELRAHRPLTALWRGREPSPAARRLLGAIAAPARGASRLARP